MAADHALLGNEFGQLGAILYDLVNARDHASTYTATGLNTRRTQVEAMFDADTPGTQFVPIAQAFLERVHAAYNGLIRDWYNTVFEAWVKHRVRVQIDGNGRNVPDLIREWFETMLEDAEDVEANTISLSTAVTADGDNAGDGTLVVAITEPFEERNNERIQSAKYRAVCRSSSFDGSAAVGAEVFQISSDLHPRKFDVPGKLAEGIASNRCTNGGFENFGNDTADEFDDWTQVTGADAQFVQSSTAYRGTYSLEIDGDGSTATIEIKQPETAWAGYSTTARAKPRRHYCLSARIKTDGGTGIAAGDTFTIQVKGTGFTPSATISIAGADSADWTLYTAAFVMPIEIPPDLAIHISYAGTPAAGAHVLVDDLILQEMTTSEQMGLAVAVVPGATAFVGGGTLAAVPHQDYFVFATTNSYGKRAQTILSRITNPFELVRREFPGPHRQLPSATSASAAYAESKFTV